jgi:hypothetical protein
MMRIRVSEFQSKKMGNIESHLILTGGFCYGDSERSPKKMGGAGGEIL